MADVPIVQTNSIYPNPMSQQQVVASNILPTQGTIGTRIAPTYLLPPNAPRQVRFEDPYYTQQTADLRLTDVGSVRDIIYQQQPVREIVPVNRAMPNRMLAIKAGNAQDWMHNMLGINTSQSPKKSKSKKSKNRLW